jgi:hypothetical protein
MFLFLLRVDRIDPNVYDALYTYAATHGFKILKVYQTNDTTSLVFQCRCEKRMQEFPRIPLEEDVTITAVCDTTSISRTLNVCNTTRYFFTGGISTHSHWIISLPVLITISLAQWQQLWIQFGVHCESVTIQEKVINFNLVSCRVLTYTLSINKQQQVALHEKKHETTDLRVILRPI